MSNRSPERGRPSLKEPEGQGHLNSASWLIPPSLRRRLVSGGAWALGGKATNVAMSLAVSALLARLLTPSDMGAYFLAFSIVTVGGVVARMGLENVVVKLVAENLGLSRLTQARRVLKPIFLMTMIGGLLVGGLLSLGLGRWAAIELFDSPGMTRVAPLLGLWVLALTVQTVLAETFRGLHDIRLATVLGPTATGILSTSAFGLLWLVTGRVSLAMVVGISVSVVALIATISAIVLKRKATQLTGGTSHPVTIGEVFRESWPLLITNATAIAATQADLWVVGAFRAEADVAIYGAAARLVLLVSISLTIANQVLPPIISELTVQNQRDRLQRVLQGTAAAVALPAVLVFLVLALEGRQVLQLVFGSHYQAGALILAILAVGRFVGVAVGACEFTLIMTGNQRALAIIAVLTAVVLICGSLIVVRPYGTVGVASVSSATIAVQQLIMLLVARKQAGVWTHADPFALYRAIKTRQQK